MFITIPSHFLSHLLPTAKMLYFIGLGLSDEKDITVKGLEIVQRASRVYLEAYTAILMVSQEKLVRRTLLSLEGVGY
jgi:hypothetical protein